ncbi:MAG: pyridoxamine 5'-phosphate oxidase family protein [Candidatus Theseobacter exili]|nr:pyridoxamine 5'-phosphate oxidase family protein [Candidatus Theseobacter exili]
MIAEEKLFNQIKTFLQVEHFAVLATQGEEYPYCSLVGYASTADCKEVLFATDRQTHKYENLVNNPKVSMLIDSQTNQENDFKDAQALTILGSAREVDIDEHPEYLTLYLKKHPALKEFVTSPDCALIKIVVDKYIMVTDFQDVQECSM